MSTLRESSITGAHEVQLRDLAARILPLLSAAKEEDLPILDYLVGGIHALVRARDLKFKDRPEKHPERYWKQGPSDTARMLKEGQARSDGRWLAGFYFNSSLARTAAVYERLIGASRAAQEGKKQRNGKERGIQQRCANAVLVAKEVNKLKHKRPGLSAGREVKADHAVAALREVVELAEETWQLPPKRPAAKHTAGPR